MLLINIHHIDDSQSDSKAYTRDHWNTVQLTRFTPYTRRNVVFFVIFIFFYLTCCVVVVYEFLYNVTNGRSQNLSFSLILGLDPRLKHGLDVAIPLRLALT